jgi:hypothetical protein
LLIAWLVYAFSAMGWYFINHQASTCPSPVSLTLASSTVSGRPAKLVMLADKAMSTSNAEANLETILESNLEIIYCTILKIA